MANEHENWRASREDPDESRKPTKCTECRREIPMGEDALTLERVVIGPRGPVPLGDLKFFHVSRCFAEYVCSTESLPAPKRIP